MKFGIFYEHQLPRPWAPDSEYRLLQESLAQIELADRLGLDLSQESWAAPSRPGRPAGRGPLAGRGVLVYAAGAAGTCLGDRPRCWLRRACQALKGTGGDGHRV